MCSKVTVVATDFFAVMADLISGFLHYLLMASLSYIKVGKYKKIFFLASISSKKPAKLFFLISFLGFEKWLNKSIKAQCSSTYMYTNQVSLTY